MSNYLNLKKIQLTIPDLIKYGEYGYSHPFNKVFVFDDIKSSREHILPDSEHILDIQIKSVDVKKLADSLYDFDPKYIGDEIGCILKTSTNKEEDFCSTDRCTNEDYLRYYLYRGYIEFTPHYSSNELHFRIQLIENSTYLYYNLSGYRRLYDYLKMPNITS